MIFVCTHLLIAAHGWSVGVEAFCAVPSLGLVFCIIIVSASSSVMLSPATVMPWILYYGFVFLIGPVALGIITF